MITLVEEESANQTIIYHDVVNERSKMVVGEVILQRSVAPIPKERGTNIA